MAEDYGRTELLRKGQKSIIDIERQVSISCGGWNFVGESGTPGNSIRISAANVPRCPHCHPVQPRTNAGMPRKLVSATHQHEEYSLEGILGISLVRQSSTTDSPDD